jgi:hypothetical protein
MFAIQLLHKSGGSKSISAPTIAAAKEAAAKFTEQFKTSYVACTIPYAVYKSKGWKNVYDTSLPFEILQGLGTELRLLYKDVSGEACLDDCPPEKEDNAV